MRVLDDGLVTRVGSDHAISTDVRVIAATHENLATLAKHRRFREDLYYRLNVVVLHLPALREHAEDIPRLATAFLGRFRTRYDCRLKGITSKAMRALCQHSWPGNVRELRNVIEGAVVLSTAASITVKDLPEHVRNRNPQQVVNAALDSCSLTAAKRLAVENALARAHGKKGVAAQLLGCSRKGLWSLLKKQNGHNGHA